MEILLIEALRVVPAGAAQPGLLRGLADLPIGAALRSMHGDVERPWTIPQLAREAGMSRSAFFGRFVRTVGVRPMAYLLAWRMAVAKSLLRGGDIALDEVARRVGYAFGRRTAPIFARSMVAARK